MQAVKCWARTLRLMSWDLTQAFPTKGQWSERGLKRGLLHGNKHTVTKIQQLAIPQDYVLKYAHSVL